MKKPTIYEVKRQLEANGSTFFDRSHMRNPHHCLRHYRVIGTEHVGVYMITLTLPCFSRETEKRGTWYYTNTPTGAYIAPTLDALRAKAGNIVWG